MPDKFLSWPVTPRIVNQYFGENKSCVDLATNSRVITCDGLNPPAGYKSLYGPLGHLGLDLRALHSQPVYCAADGVVDFIDTNPRSGLDVRVVTERNGIKYQHIYEHLLGYQPRVGDSIKKGDLTGWADSTGYSSADHLHFELQQWIDNAWVPIDPLPFLDDLYALDAKLLQSKLDYLKEQLAVISDKIAEWLRVR